MKETLKFPKGFLWGSATSSEQIEPKDSSMIGNQAETNWQASFKKDIDKYFDGQFCRNDFWNKYEEDLEIAKNLNYNSLRLSISWSRFLPDGVNPDLEVVKHYKKIFKTAKDKGIKLILNLMHFEMPQFITKQGGFGGRASVEYYRTFAREAFKHFGEYASFWSTFNEAWNVSAAQSLLGFHPMEKEFVGFEHFVKSYWHIALSGAIAVEEFKKAGLQGKSKIGCIYVGGTSISRSNNPEDVRATHIEELMTFNAYFDSNVIGEFPQELIDLLSEIGYWPEDLIQPGDKELIKNNTIEWVGLNYYQPKRVQADNGIDEVSEFGVTSIQGRSIFPNDLGINLFKFWSKPGARMNTSRGMEIYPQALYTKIKEIQEKYNNFPMIITENGMGIMEESKYKKNGIIQDTYRIKYISEHLYHIHKAISEGANVIGYHMWTYIDNWSWTNAYKNRYGHIELDIKTGERREKLSASWMRNLASANELEYDTDDLEQEILFPDFENKS